MVRTARCRGSALIKESGAAPRSPSHLTSVAACPDQDAVLPDLKCSKGLPTFLMAHGLSAMHSGFSTPQRESLDLLPRLCGLVVVPLWTPIPILSLVKAGCSIHTLH